MSRTRELFFPFLDRSLAYDCQSCGSSCCKASGIALEARTELIQFARFAPRGAAFLRPSSHGERLAELQHLLDGCWMLRPDGLCDVEVQEGHAAKPSVCRLFPFNRLQDADTAVVVGIAAALCPMRDAADARDGQSWEGLRHELLREPLEELPPQPLPPAAQELKWLEFEAQLRDASLAHLHDADYVSFAAFQEAAALALLKNTPLPEPHAPELAERGERLAGLLREWRGLFGSADDPRLPEASRRAARQATLLTSSWRMQWLLRGNPDDYPTELQRLPRQLLASALLVELQHLAHRRVAELRVAMQTRLATLPHAALLTLFDKRLTLRAPLQAISAPAELRALIAALSASLFSAPRPLAISMHEALAGVEPHLRALAFSWLAHSGAQLDTV